MPMHRQSCARALLIAALGAAAACASAYSQNTPAPETAFTLQLLHFADADGASTTAGRVRSLKVGDDVVVRDGVVQGDPSRTFRLVTLNFLAGGGDGYKFGASDNTGAGLPNLLKLEADPASATALGGQVSLTAGGEQDAMAEYLKQSFGTTPYALPDTPASADTRIQNLQKRSDTVLN